MNKMHVFKKTGCLNLDTFAPVFQIGLKSEAKKKAIWMDCGIHAREWIAPAFCQYFVRQVNRLDLQNLHCFIVR